MKNEDDLCADFAAKAKGSPEFCQWLLGKTKFQRVASSLNLMAEQQAAARPAVKPERWWRHWCCTFSNEGKQGETDIFLVFQSAVDDSRIALHIENKIAAPLSTEQARAYRERARFMAGKPQYLNYSDFATMLICSQTYHRENQDKARQFDSVVFYHQIGDFVPSFRRT